MSETKTKKPPSSKLTLWIADSLIERAKILAVRRRVSLSHLVSVLLERELAADGEQAPAQ